RVLQRVGVVAGDVAELGRPQGGVQRAGQQLVDLLGALGGVLVGQEGAHLLGGGQAAGGVDADAAEELGGGGQLRGGDVEPAQLGEDLAVDVVDLRRPGVLEAGRRGHGHHHAHGQDVAAVGDDDRGVAGPAGADRALVGDGGDGLVVGAEV